jgi:signal transduction histidine kinase
MGLTAGLAVLGGAGSLGIARMTRREEAAHEVVLRGAGVLYVEMFGQLIERVFDQVTMVHELAAVLRRNSLHQSSGRDEMDPVAATHLTQIAHEERAGIFQIAIIDHDGQLAWSTIPNWPASDLSDREHFRVHAAGQLTPFISAPLRGRASLRTSIQLTRPILGRDGTFLGVAVVSIDPNALSNNLNLAPMEPGSTVLLARSDGLIIASNDMRDLLKGQRLGEGNRHRFMSEFSGTDFVFGSRTGTRRIVAWRQIPGWPAVVIHAVPRGLARQRAELVTKGYQSALIGGLAACLSLGAAAMVWNSGRVSRREAREAEMARQDSNEMLSALPGAAYRVSFPPEAEPNWAEANAAVAQMMGHDGLEPGSANPFEALMNSEGLAQRANLLRGIMANGEAVIEYNGLRRDRRLIRIREHARLLPKTRLHGRVIVGLMTDVTAERNLEARALTAARMINLGEMATGLAHEINQPATAIALAADVAAMELNQLPGEAPEALHRGLEDIAEQASRLRDVIAHFRAFSQPAREAQPLGVVSLQAAIQGARRIVDGVLAGSGVNVRSNLPVEPLLVRARQVPLEQVIVNVLINARDALLHQPEIARVVELSAKADQISNTVNLRIRDYGTGIPDDVLPHIFESFFTTKSPEKGTGIGLSLALATMQSFGGSIAARNHPEGGAEFSMVLLAAPHV